MKSSVLAAFVGMVIMAAVSAADVEVHSMTDAGLHPPPAERISAPPHPSDVHGRHKRQACGSPTLLTSAQQTETLNQHNFDRSLEPSSDEFAMHWDVNLAAQAQLYASQCVWQHGMLTDCAGNSVGQNLFMTWMTSGQFPTLNMTKAVESWYSERQYWNYTTSTCQPNQVCGHFTQMVWATTTLVGCGYYMCPSVYVPGGTNVTNGVFVVCDYSPPGNVVGQQPYITGVACNNCSTITRSSTTAYKGYTCTSGLCSACNPAVDQSCQCGPADSCSGHGTWQVSSCTCLCNSGYYGSTCQNACVDAAGQSSCAYWQSLSYCLSTSVYYAYMQANCAATCGVCSV